MIEVHVVGTENTPQWSTLSSFTNYMALEQICCSILATNAYIWSIRPGNKLHVSGKFVFLHKKCYVPFFNLENSWVFIL